MDTKNNYRKLIKLSDQLEHMTAFLGENTNVMRNAKEKAGQINRDERKNIEQLIEKLIKMNQALTHRIKELEPKLTLLKQKCVALQESSHRELQNQVIFNHRILAEELTTVVFHRLSAHRLSALGKFSKTSQIVRSGKVL